MSLVGLCRGLERHSSGSFLILGGGDTPQLVVLGLGGGNAFGELGAFRLVFRDSYQCFGFVSDGVCGRLRLCFLLAQFEDARVEFGAAPARTGAELIALVFGKGRTNGSVPRSQN